jgi:hypothetical protein
MKKLGGGFFSNENMSRSLMAVVAVFLITIVILSVLLVRYARGEPGLQVDNIDVNNATSFLNENGFTVFETDKLPAGELVGTTDSQTLTNKSLSNANIANPAITGGTVRDAKITEAIIDSSILNSPSITDYPTGRMADFVLATNDALPAVKAQADDILTGINDDVMINQAMATVKRGTVGVVGPNVFLGGLITVPAGISLEIGKQTVVQPTANTDMFRIAYGGVLRGGIYYTDVRGFIWNKRVVYIDGADKGHNPSDPFPNPSSQYYSYVFNDATLIGRYGDYGVGFDMELDGPNEYVQQAYVHDIRTSGFNTAFKMVASAAGSWANGNVFRNLWILHPIQAIDIDDGGYLGIQGNTIDANIQAAAITQVVLTCVSSYNQFNLNIYDWHIAEGKYALEFQGGNRAGIFNYVTLGLFSDGTRTVDNSVDQNAHQLQLNRGNYINSYVDKKILMQGWTQITQ